MKYINSIFPLLIFIVSSSCYGETKTIGDWTVYVTDSKSGVFAFTQSESGTLFGLMCRTQDKGCMWTMKTGNRCEADSESHALLNSDLGVLSVETLCQETMNGENYVHLGSFDEVEQIVKGAKTLGIAMPLVDGKFRAIRFSLIGSSQAVDSAYALYGALRESIDDEIL